MKNKLKIGLLLDNKNIPFWSYTMLKEIKESDYAEIVLIVYNHSKNDVENTQKEKDSRYKNIIYTLFRKLDKKMYPCNPDAFEKKDINTLLSVDNINVNTKKDKKYDIINENDLSQIKKYKIDILIKLGFHNLRGQILAIPKYGVWTYQYGSKKLSSKSLIGFYDVIEKRNETEVVLQILNDNPDADKVIFRSYSLPDIKSVNLNLNKMYWNALSFIPSKINELFNIGEIEFFNRIKEFNKEPHFYSDRLNTIPNNWEMLIYIYKIILTKIKNRINFNSYFGQWMLLYKMNSGNAISTSFYQFTKIIPPKDRFWADPHIIRKNDKYYIFIEELLYAENKGFISVIEMDNNGNYKPPVKVLETDYHLSYPFLIEDNNKLFMIPESNANNTIDLYQCVNFPLKWELVTTLINNIKAADSTIIYRDNIYWLFTNVLRNERSSIHDELHIFFSDKLISNNWESHPKNPVISDVKRSRPAGNFFEYNEDIYRPSQNCSKQYGYGMKINKVIKLTKTEYKETVIDSIFPDWDKKLSATHTINSVEKLTIIDALMKRRK